MDGYVPYLTISNFCMDKLRNRQTPIIQHFFSGNIFFLKIYFYCIKIYFLLEWTKILCCLQWLEIYCFIGMLRRLATVPNFDTLNLSYLCRHSIVENRFPGVYIKAGFWIRIWIRSDSDLFGRIRSRKIFTGSGSVSGSYRYFGNVKLYKQGIIEVLDIFSWIFTFFQIKIIIIQISEEIWLMVKKNLMLELILCKCQ